MIPLPYKAVAVFAVLGAVAIGSYMKGLSSGRIGQLQDTVEAYEKRKGIDDEVSGVTRYNLCLEHGGLHDQCKQLRGLDETAEGK